MIDAQALETLLRELPPQVSASLMAQAEILNSSRPLRVVCLGSYSVGKSSVLNAMLDEKLLPTGDEEVTAIPTLLKHELSSVASFDLCYAQDDPVALSRSAFDELVTGHRSLDAALSKTPGDEESLSYLRVSYPSAWLSGLELFDLPGLSGNDPDRSALTRAQVQEADAVIYLLFPKGPTQPDVEMINYILAQGKALMVCVAQWDKAQEAESRGEPLPSLERWSQQLSKLTLGLRPDQDLVDLTPISAYTGFGIDKIKAWLVELSRGEVAIKHQRFSANILPLIKAELRRVEETLSLLTDQEESEQQELHERLMSAQHLLVNQERELSGQRSDRWREISKVVERLQSKSLSSLRSQLELRKTAWCEDHSGDLSTRWSDYVNEALMLRRSTLDQHLNELRSVQESQLDLSEIFVDEQFALTPPTTPEFSLDQARELADLERMKAEASMLRETLAEPAQDSNERLLKIEEQRAQLDAQIEAMQEQQTELLNTPLPMVEQSGSQRGSFVGRVVGEVLDLGLMWFQPQLIATKVGSVASKFGAGAKAVKNISKSVERVATLKQGTGSKDDPLSKVSGFMSALSVSYWGEKIGSLFDQPPTLRVDEAGASALRAQRHQVNASLHALFEKQHQLSQELEESGGNQRILEETKQDLARVEREISALEAQLKREQAEEKSYIEQQVEQQLNRRLEQLVTQSLLRLQAEMRGAEHAVRESFKQFWDEELQSSLSEHRSHIGQLEDLSRRSPEERAQERLAYERVAEQLHALAAQVKGEA